MTIKAESNETLSDLQVTLGKAKAVAEAYSILYVDAANAEERSLAVLSSPEMQCNLFAVLEDLIFDACQLADSI